MGAAEIEVAALQEANVVRLLLLQLELLRHAHDALKRLLDVGGSLALLVLLSPVFLIVAALVKLTSAGPVFFRQVRVGASGEPFTMLKFRTMHPAGSAPPTSEWVQDNVGRITRVGKWLRRFRVERENPAGEAFGQERGETIFERAPATSVRQDHSRLLIAPLSKANQLHLSRLSGSRNHRRSENCCR